MLCITVDSPGFETEKDPVGFLSTEDFCPLFLVGKTQASMTFPEFQKADRTWLLNKGGAGKKNALRKIKRTREAH